MRALRTALLPPALALCGSRGRGSFKHLLLRTAPGPCARLSALPAFDHAPSFCALCWRGLPPNRHFALLCLRSGRSGSAGAGRSDLAVNAGLPCRPGPPPCCPARGTPRPTRLCLPALFVLSLSPTDVAWMPRPLRPAPFFRPRVARVRVCLRLVSRPCPQSGGAFRLHALGPRVRAAGFEFCRPISFVAAHAIATPSARPLVAFRYLSSTLAVLFCWAVATRGLGPAVLDARPVCCALSLRGLRLIALSPDPGPCRLTGVRFQRGLRRPGLPISFALGSGNCRRGLVYLAPARPRSRPVPLRR